MPPLFDEGVTLMTKRRWREAAECFRQVTHTLAPGMKSGRDPALYHMERFGLDPVTALGVE
jgi:hypothetical protein